MTTVNNDINIYEAAALIGVKNWMNDVDYIAPPETFADWTWAADEYINRAISEN